MAETLLPKKEEDPVCSILTWETEADFNAFYSSDAIKELYKSEDMKTVQAGTEKVVTRKYSLGYGWHQ